MRKMKAVLGIPHEDDKVFINLLSLVFLPSWGEARERVHASFKRRGHLLLAEKVRRCVRYEPDAMPATMGTELAVPTTTKQPVTATVLAPSAYSPAFGLNRLSTKLATSRHEHAARQVPVADVDSPPAHR